MTRSDAWDVEFARHCASLRRLKTERGWLTQAQWDDIESAVQIATLDRRIEERRAQQQYHDL